MKVTAKEIAKKMNISEAAVSMALNNKKGVSEKRRKEIIEVAKEMGYDFIRLEEKTSFNGVIAFVNYTKNNAVVSDTPFFQKLSYGIMNECKKHYYSLYTVSISNDEDIFREIKAIEKQNISGVILLATEIDEANLRLFTNAFSNLVVLDTYFENISTNYVHINNVQGAYLACQHLLKKYHKQPGYLKSSYRINNFDERADGFYKCIRKSGLSASKSIVHELSPSIDGAYYDMLEILKNNEETTNIYFADNDSIALGALKAFERMGTNIHRDFHIVGFDNIYSSIPGYYYSSINIEKEYLGAEAVDRLVKILKTNDKKYEKIEINTNIIVRD